MHEENKDLETRHKKEPLTVQDKISLVIVYAFWAWFFISLLK